jgi:transcriptional regulator with XRE-family HTH domain
MQAKRMEKKLTLGRVAAKMGIAFTLVRSWENGTSRPNDRQLKHLTDFFGIRPPWRPTLQGQKQIATILECAGQ